MTSNTIITIIVLAILVAGIGLVVVQSSKKQAVSAISNYEECVAAGYPILESYPEKCATPDGRMFTNEAHTLPTNQ